MAKFNLDNYETVEDRLKVFWKDNPQGRISTDVVHITDDGTCVTIKAEIFVWQEDIGLYCVSTGIAQETKGQGGFANADAWMENCETSAIGRALANWKYQGNTKPRPSREEMSKVQVEKKPVKKPTKEEQAAMKKVVDKMVPDDEKKSPVAEQLNHSLKVMIPDEDKRNDLKTKVYNELVNMDVADKDITKWTADNMSTFLTRVEDYLERDTSKPETTKDIVEEVFGEVTDKSEKICLLCNKSGNIEDNREKKDADPGKFGKIPDFACSNYQDKDGCGQGWWMNNAPTEWL